MARDKELQKKEVLTRLIFNRRKYYISYIPYHSKKAYYNAIAEGDISLVKKLNHDNSQYYKTLYEKYGSYSDALYQFQYECTCTTIEFCLIAVQNGLTDMIAYDVRDEFIIDISATDSLFHVYQLFCKMAVEFATLVHYTILRSPSSPATSQMMSFISSHIEEKISLQDVADSANLSRNYASKLFKEEIGLGINDYITLERINKARQLLIDSDLSLYEISHRLNYCSQSYFSKQFLEHTHMTPGEYRKSFR